MSGLGALIAGLREAGVVVPVVGGGHAGAAVARGRRRAPAANGPRPPAGANACGWRQDDAAIHRLPPAGGTVPPHLPQRGRVPGPATTAASPPL